MSATRLLIPMSLLLAAALLIPAVALPADLASTATVRTAEASSLPIVPAHLKWPAATHGTADVIATIPVGDDPWAVAVNPATDRIYVANHDGDTLTVIDGFSNQVIATIPLDGHPGVQIGVNPNTNRIFVPDRVSRKLLVIDGATNTVIEAVTSYYIHAPEGVGVHTGRNQIYLSDDSDALEADRMSVIDGANDQVWAVPFVGWNQHTIAVNPATDRIYGSSRYLGGWRTWVMNAANLGILTWNDVRGHMALNPTTNRVYIANFDASRVTVADGADLGIITTINKDSSDGFPGINTRTNCIYAPNPDANSVSIIDGATNSVVNTVTAGLGSGVYAAAVNPNSELIYVTNRTSNTVSVIQDSACGPKPIVSALRAGGRPTIDGDLAEWQALGQTVLARDTADSITGSVANPTPADLSAGLRAVWAPEALYFAATMSDDVLAGNNSSQIWGDDTVELSLRVGETSHQFSLALDGRTEDQGNPIATLAHITRTLAGGWALEVAIPAAVLGLPAFTPGPQFAFTWGLWDDDLFTYPGQTHMIWRGSSTFTYQPEWGTLSLNPAVYDFPPRDTPTPTATATPTRTPSPTPIEPPLGHPGDENWSDGFQALGVDGYVSALTVGSDGSLYAGGHFTMAGGVAANQIARWDGTSWHSLGTGVSGWVYALAMDGGGNLYAGGNFHTAGGVPADCIARWDGVSWHPLGTGVSGSVEALAVDRDGSTVYAAGYFTNAGGLSVNRIAKWNGSSWSALGAGMDGSIDALAADRDGNLYAGGDFHTAGGVPANYVAKWDGTSWSALGGGTTFWVYALAVDGDGNLYAGAAGAMPVERVAKWNGISWSAVGGGTDWDVYTLTLDGGGSLYAGGGPSLTDHIAKWDGTSWRTLGSGIDDYVFALAVDGKGNLYAGGQFDHAGGAPAGRVARWTATDGWAISGPGTYTFYANNLPVTIVVPPGGQGDLARIILQRFDKSHANASPALRTGYYWQIEGLSASRRTASGYSINLTFSAPGFTPDGDEQACSYTAPGTTWDCAATSYTAYTITRYGVTELSEWAVSNRGSTLYLPVVLR